MTKRTQRIFYGLCILAILAISFWGIIYNKAYLKVSSDDGRPFQVSVGNQLVTCEPVCDIELAPRSYTVTKSRTGFSTSEERVFLVRGRTLELTYSPIFLPVFNVLEPDSIQPFESFRFTQNLQNPDQQVFQINTPEDFRTVSTFRLPLANPDATLSSDLSQAFIWNITDDQQPEYYLVDINQESRQRIALSLPTNTVPSEFKLLTENKLLLKQDGIVYLYNLSASNYRQFSVSSVNHVEVFEDNSESRIILLTDRTLTTGIAPSSTGSRSLTQILELPDLEESALAEEVVSRPDKIFAYQPDTQSFQYLGPIPNDIVYPFYFETVLVNSETTQVLTNQQESFQINLTEN